MSVQKLISEAEKLLEKQKFPEAIEKLNTALKSEPMNQLVVSKLASAHAENGEPQKAGSVLVSMANRLSEAGKAQVAIAIFKQALDYLPNDISLKLRYAQECEGVGKVGEAQTYAQQVFQFYVKRKKYFEAANINPMLVRLNAKDERLKFAWLEVLQLSQAEQKLIHLIVALCGPPGLVSAEFNVGGEPAAMSESLYEGVKRLVAFFPRDAKIAYAVAWSAYRRGRMKDFFHFLGECLRREPDFCLGILLFARYLTEAQKLNEAFYVYKMLRERLGMDKSADEKLTLNRLVETFVEKNGWIAFTEQSGEVLDTPEFLRLIIGAEAAAAAASAETPSPGEKTKNTSRVSDQMPPAEIELSLGEPSESESLEVQHLAGEAEKPPVEIPIVTPPAAPEPEAAPNALAPAAEAFDATMVMPAPPTSSVESSIGLLGAAPLPVQEMPKPEPAPESASEPAPEAKVTFTPAPAATIAPPAETEVLAGEKTELISPIDLVGINDSLNKSSASVETKGVLYPAGASAEMPPIQGEAAEEKLPQNNEEDKTVLTQAPAPERPMDDWHALKLDGVPTEIFSPLEVIQAQKDSMRQWQSGETAAPETETVAAPPDAEPANGIMPIPTASSDAAPGSDAAADPGAGVDLGDDLLEGPTRMIINAPPADATQHMLREIRQDAGKSADESPDPELLMRKAERYIAKRNYYLARKALRHALGLGADEATVKERLRDIRKLEMPNSLYNTISSDGTRERSSDILERLENEFEIPASGAESAELQANIEDKLESIFQESDPRTILDFGVGLHEMGLYRPAEQLFSRMVTEFPDFAFDAYYLAAMSKLSRKDYAGAASILKKLSIDSGKSESEKIQIYYALGELFEKMQQLDRSKEFFQKVARLDSNYRNIRHKLEE